jgi:hypothetical protein
MVMGAGEMRRYGIEAGSRRSVMPTVTNPNLTLTESEGRVTIRVRYDATFSGFERQLVGLGAEYHSHIGIHDFDGGDTVGTELVEFPTQTFPITVGSSDQVFHRDQSKTVNRSELKGDPADNDDELKARIRIHTNDAMVSFTPDVISDQEVLAD